MEIIICSEFEASLSYRTSCHKQKTHSTHLPPKSKRTRTKKQEVIGGKKTVVYPDLSVSRALLFHFVDILLYLVNVVMIYCLGDECLFVLKLVVNC